MLLVFLVWQDRPAVSFPCGASVSKKTGFGKSANESGPRRDMSCGHGFRLGTHSKIGAFCTQ
jgi:hypothetical protein